MDKTPVFGKHGGCSLMTDYVVKTGVSKNGRSSPTTHYVIRLLDNVCMSHLDKIAPSDKDYTGPSVKKKAKSTQQCNTLDRYFNKVT